MISLSLSLLPIAFALASLLAAGRRASPLILVAGGVAQVAISIHLAVTTGNHEDLEGYTRIDATTHLFSILINVLFVGIAGYVWNRGRTTPELAADIQRFVPLALFFLAAANFAVVSNHALATWVSLELTTLLAAPLIVRRGVASSRWAAFRYLLFSSVGLGLSLVGFLCLARSVEASGHTPTFFLDELPALVAGPADTWRNLGLALVILGYCTKLGLAPMYTWLPEAYDEAPPAVTALLATVQFNCALVGLLRVLQIYRPGNGELIEGELLVIGLLSMAVSTLSIIATCNMKRLLAYASINHAGVIAIGLGVGEHAAYGVVLYVVSNAFIKAILFLTAGKIKAHYQTKDTREIAGLLKDLPYSGLFLMVGTFALLGFPPFGSFLGELLILSGLVDSGQILVFAAFTTLITATFVATARTIFPMIWGEPKHHISWPRQTAMAASPKLFFLAALVVMGLYIPPPVNDVFRDVARTLGGSTAREVTR